MTTAMMFQPRTEVQMNLLADMARQMRITFDYVSKEDVRAIKRRLNAKTLEAVRESETGTCERFATIEDYLKAFS